MAVEKHDYISVEHLHKTFHDNQQDLEVLRDIDFRVQKGEFICIVGGSGCGKSTLIRAMVGLDSQHEGSVFIDDQEIQKPGKDRGYVFQEHRLFPWLTVEENISFALDEGTKEVKLKKTAECIELVGLKGFEKTYPKALSGGMAQRVNIARALVNNPPVLFLDEPFGALDAFTKMQLQDELLKIREKEGNTMLMVTHDIDEAIYLADRIIVMSKRPGGVRDIVNVNLPRPRNRNDYHFMELRKRVYKYFFRPVEMEEDYVI